MSPRHTGTAPDPLEDEQRGPCDCDAGWRTVQPSYADHLYPAPTLDEMAGLTEADQFVLLQQIETKRAGAARSVYPCRRCNPTAFYRWAAGHWSADHDPGGCADCMTAQGRQPRRARSRPVPNSESPPAPMPDDSRRYGT